MRYLLLLILLSLSTALFSQSITSILYTERNKVDTLIAEISETKIEDSNAGGWYSKDKYIYLKGILQVRENYDVTTNLLNIKQSYFYNDDKLDTIFFEFWTKLGYMSHKNKYVYNDTGLIKILIYDGNDELKSYCLVVNNEKKLPVSLKNVNANETIIGIEKAVYDFENNEVNISIYNDKGVLFNNGIYSINFLKNMQDIILNEKGDKTAYKQKLSYNSKEVVQFEIEYDYDKRNNWVKKKEFVLEGQKRKKYQTVKRTITYVN
ncbi:hypothetical protein VB264_06765 [Arcicella aquatica]|uniref:Uncharacterized protein n=1 Tax=Arcicella aquatica TaxID=217141 RepID=A0ABU5QK88_9BACT|nr:hypothetical protein [Arcicella aquatica]MEA5257476.1 hypothetical protein [Arcicella aquatica]